MSNDQIKPKEWALENKKGFIDWTYKTFNPTKYHDHDSSKRSSLFKHQKIIRDYLQIHSPYRGIVLYHGLGVGKTRSSIAAVEGYALRNKRIVIMVPASLAQNYKSEIIKFSSVGSPWMKTWNIVNIKSNLKIADALNIDVKIARKHSGVLCIPDIPEDFPEEYIVKTKLTWKTLSTQEQSIALDVLNYIVETRFTFINYNGVTQEYISSLDKDFFDNSFVVIDETHNFISRVINGGKVSKQLFNMIMNAKNIKMVLLTGTPIINHPFELSLLINLVRGPIEVYDASFLKTAKGIPELKEVKDGLKEANLLKYVDTIHVDDSNNIIRFTLLPYSYVNKHNEKQLIKDSEVNQNHDNNFTIEYEKWTKSPNKVAGDIATLFNTKFKTGIKLHIGEVYALPSKKDDFNKLFIDETDIDNPRVKNMDLFQKRILGTTSYYKTDGDNFPTVTKRVIEEVPLSNYQFSVYDKVRDQERKMESNKRKTAQMSGLLGSKNTVYRAFSRMTCNFVFPESIKRPFPKDIRKAMKKEIDIAEEDDTKGDKETKDVKEEKEDVKVIKAYDNAVKKAMKDLDQQSEEILTLDKLESLYSPKFSRMLLHIEESPGKCLVYTQFRTVEGVGVLKLSLDTLGYIELNVERLDGKWIIADEEEVMDPKYNNRRYIIFGTDADKNKILLDLYNNNSTTLPSELKPYLQPNLYGDFIKVIMITQSGAEGISLKCVRTVIITEPFWNMVRIEQVIGRAIRAFSHTDLPKVDQNVSVYIMTSVFSEKQLRNAFTLRRLDNSMTSDTHILSIAEKKDAINQQFLQQLKVTAVDCRFNSENNKPLNNNWQCFSFPIPYDENEDSYSPSIEEDLSKTKAFSKAKKIQGHAIMKDGKKYVIVDEYSDKIFDYNAYKNAGVLVPV